MVSRASARTEVRIYHGSGGMLEFAHTGDTAMILSLEYALAMKRMPARNAIVVSPVGLEPTTPRLKVSCSTT